MKLILIFCLCALVFSQSIESQNEELKMKNQVLLKTLRELAVGEGDICEGKGCGECLDDTDYACAFYDGECILSESMENPADYKASKFVWSSGNCPTVEALATKSEEKAVSGGTPGVIDDTYLCYKRCRRRGNGFEECCDHCSIDCDKDTEEQVADDGGCYNRCRATGKSPTECASDCPVPEDTEPQHEQSTEAEVGGTNPWPCRSTNKVGHNRSINPGDMCNTDWGHLSYWRARHEYCKNDKGNWGCQYGYKRVGWWNDYCCSKHESRNTNKCKCR